MNILDFSHVFQKVIFKVSQRDVGNPENVDSGYHIAIIGRVVLVGVSGHGLSVHRGVEALL